MFRYYLNHLWFSNPFYPHRSTAAAGQPQMQGRKAADHLLTDGHRVGVAFVVGTGAVFVDDGAVLLLSYLTVGDDGLAPRRGAALDECQGGLTLVVLDGIGSHLQRTVDDDELAQLLGQGRVGVGTLDY